MNGQYSMHADCQRTRVLMANDDGRDPLATPSILPPKGSGLLVCGFCHPGRCIGCHHRVSHTLLVARSGATYTIPFFHLYSFHLYSLVSCASHHHGYRQTPRRGDSPALFPLPVAVLTPDRLSLPSPRLDEVAEEEDEEGPEVPLPLTLERDTRPMYPTRLQPSQPSSPSPARPPRSSSATFLKTLPKLPSECVDLRHGARDTC
jgi:hypothetical protein